MTNLYKPALIGINNLVAFLINDRELVFPKPIELKTLSIASVAFSFLFLGLILFFSLSRGRQYCNLICPVGSLLGYVSTGSLFRIRLDKNLCNSCGACQVKCKAGCIDSKNKKVDITRCIACFDCLNTCPSDGLKYLPISFTQVGSKQEIKQVDGSKRQFLFLTASMLLGLIWKTYGQAKRPEEQDTAIQTGLTTDSSALPSASPPTPPGSISLDHFVQICTACHLCITTCPTQVLQPSLLEYGWTGLMQPQMDYITSFCEYECNLCTQICPTGAILPLTIEEKKITQLGKSRFIKKECIVYTKNTACGACSEHCPTKAVYMIPYENGLTIPEINNEICVGCGACEYSCPTDPKAIVVDANRYHQIAKLPDNSKIEKKINYKEEFPF
jgi:ferredoxin